MCVIESPDPSSIKRQNNAVRNKARSIVTSKVGIEFFHAAQAGLCGICHHPMDLSNPDKLNVDHVWPIHAHTCNGHRAINAGNLVLTHIKCNSRKGNREPNLGEIAVLAMVNDVLKFDESTGQYGITRQLEVAVEERRQTIYRELSRFDQATEEESFTSHHPNTILKIRVLQKELEELDVIAAETQVIFVTYRFAHAANDLPTNTGAPA